MTSQLSPEPLRWKTSAGISPVGVTAATATLTRRTLDKQKATAATRPLAKGTTNDD